MHLKVLGGVALQRNYNHVYEKTLDAKSRQC